MLLIAAYYIFGMAFNTMAICGIFRSGGDVRFGLILDAIAMWGYAVLGGIICAFVLKIPPLWVTLCFAWMNLSKCLWSFGTIKSGSGSAILPVRIVILQFMK